MTADPAIRKATYADLETVPPHLVAEIIDGRLETHPRPAPRHGLVAGQWLLLGTVEPRDEIRVAPFDAVGFPMDALLPFDEPVAQKSSKEA